MIDTEEEMFSREKPEPDEYAGFQWTTAAKGAGNGENPSGKVQSERLQLSVLAIVIIVFIIAFLLLSRSFIEPALCKVLGIILLLITFEYIDQLLHPIVANFTNHTRVLMLLILVLIASLMVPLHYKLEKWTKYKLTERNRLIRPHQGKKDYRGTG